MSRDGFFKMYDKYRIAHMDGTPLNGKKHFVLRLDSDDPVEAARVAAAMRAYKNEPRNCDVGTAEEQYSRMFRECYECMCMDCKQNKDLRKCALSWAQLPYKKGVPNAEEKEKSC